MTNERESQGQMALRIRNELQGFPGNGTQRDTEFARRLLSAQSEQFDQMRQKCEELETELTGAHDAIDANWVTHQEVIATRQRAERAEALIEEARREGPVAVFSAVRFHPQMTREFYGYLTDSGLAKLKEGDSLYLRPLAAAQCEKCARIEAETVERCAKEAEKRISYSMPIRCPDGIDGCLVAHSVPGTREQTGAEAAKAIRALPLTAAATEKHHD